ncbi:MAG: antitoxin [Planctomycetota bacterium]
MIPLYQLLALRIHDELENLDRTARRAERVWKEARLRENDQDVYVDSAALNLSSFYSGLERLFESIAKELDGGVPKGETWHRELLRQMTFDVTGIRPPVIANESARELDEYRRFRHVVRNVYAEHLDPQRVGELVEKLCNLWGALRAELTAFAEFLERLSQADDEVPA